MSVPRYEDYKTLDEHFQTVDDAKTELYEEWEDGDISQGQARDRARELNPSYEKLMDDYNSWS